jgi:glutaredoxin 3
MARIHVYTTRWCGFCDAAKALLDRKGVEYEEIDVTDDAAFRSRLVELTNRWTVPQILVDDEPLGGYAELRDLERRGELDRKLAA